MSAPLAKTGRGPRRQFELSIGRVPLCLQMTDAGLFGAASARYSAFTHADAKPISIALNDDTAPPTAPADFAYEFEGAVLSAGTSGIRFDGVGNEYALDSLLRIFLSWQLLGLQGFLLHAATVIRNGKAYVFTGRSGAGKSTVASLSPEGSVLTDEISLIRREDGIWRAYGTPFWGEFRAAGSNTSAPVAGIFRLLQATENRVTPLSPDGHPSHAFAKRAFLFCPAAAAHQQLLEILTQAVTHISGYHLAFRRNSAFWEVLPR